MNESDLKPGTVMIEVPKSGAAAHECFVCTGPTGQPGHERELAKEAFLVGMVVGMKSLREPRPRLCVDHETELRENLATMGCSDPEVLDALGIAYRIAGESSGVKGHE